MVTTRFSNFTFLILICPAFFYHSWLLFSLSFRFLFSSVVLFPSSFVTIALPRFLPFCIYTLYTLLDYTVGVCIHAVCVDFFLPWMVSLIWLGNVRSALLFSLKSDHSRDQAHYYCLHTLFSTCFSSTFTVKAYRIYVNCSMSVFLFVC